jgi:hypothetical protein
MRDACPFVRRRPKSLHEAHRSTARMRSAQFAGRTRASRATQRHGIGRLRRAIGSPRESESTSPTLVRASRGEDIEGLSARQGATRARSDHTPGGSGSPGSLPSRDPHVVRVAHQIGAPAKPRAHLFAKPRVEHPSLFEHPCIQPLFGSGALSARCSLWRVGPWAPREDPRKALSRLLVLHLRKAVRVLRKPKSRSIFAKHSYAREGGFLVLLERHNLGANHARHE